jgi:hypothetical protein
MMPVEVTEDEVRVVAAAVHYVVHVAMEVVGDGQSQTVVKFGVGLI